MSKQIQRANDIQTKTLMKLDQYLSICKKNSTRTSTSVKPAKNMNKLNQIMKSIETLKIDIIKYRNIKKNICLYFSNIKFFLAEARLKQIEIQKITSQLNKEELNEKGDVLVLKQCHIYCRELQTYILLFQTIAELEYKCKDQKQNVEIVQKMYYFNKQQIEPSNRAHISASFALIIRLNTQQFHVAIMLTVNNARNKLKIRINVSCVGNQLMK
ncbi:hypothetical protein pb186bvf_019722 [Paramecium bursaria]